MIPYSGNAATGTNPFDPGYAPPQAPPQGFPPQGGMRPMFGQGFGQPQGGQQSPMGQPSFGQGGGQNPYEQMLMQHLHRQVPGAIPGMPGMGMGPPHVPGAPGQGGGMPGGGGGILQQIMQAQQMRQQRESLARMYGQQPVQWTQQPGGGPQPGGGQVPMGAANNQLNYLRQFSAGPAGQGPSAPPQMGPGS